MIEGEDGELKGLVWRIGRVEEGERLITQRIFPVAEGGEIGACGREGKRSTSTTRIIGRIRKSLSAIGTKDPHKAGLPPCAPYGRGFAAAGDTDDNPQGHDDRPCHG